jgi:site-specific recombinase XerC
MRGHINKTERKDGSIAWRVVTDLPPGPDGKRRQKTTTHRTKKEAETALNERLRALDTGTYHDDRIVMSTYLDQWLAGRQNIRANTRRGYNQHIRDYLTPHLGRVRLVDLRARHIEDMYQQIRARGNLSSTSIRRIHATLRVAMNAAVRRNLIAVNPATHVELEPATRPRVRVWSPAQVRTFLAANQASD